jgi:hypothetical protein
MNTPIFDALSDEWKQVISEDLKIIDEGGWDGETGILKSGLWSIANHQTDADYKSNYFYLRALAEKILDKVAR